MDDARLSTSPTTGASFEAVLGTVAATLLREPLESFDACITDTLSRLMHLLEVDRSTLGLVDPADGILRTSHAVAVPGVTPFPVERPPTSALRGSPRRSARNARRWSFRQKVTFPRKWPISRRGDRTG
jgi:hypothetical protein